VRPEPLKKPFPGGYTPRQLWPFRFSSGCGSGRRQHQAKSGPERQSTAPSRCWFHRKRNSTLAACPKAERARLSFGLPIPVKKKSTSKSIKTSCDCLSVNLQKKIIEPGEKVKAIAVVDSSHDASFTGSLRLDATGFQAETGAKAFEIYVNVKDRMTGNFASSLVAHDAGYEARQANWEPGERDPSSCVPDMAATLRETRPP